MGSDVANEYDPAYPNEYEKVVKMIRDRRNRERDNERERERERWVKYVSREAWKIVFNMVTIRLANSRYRFKVTRWLLKSNRGITNNRL